MQHEATPATDVRTADERTKFVEVKTTESQRLKAKTPDTRVTSEMLTWAGKTICEWATFTSPAAEAAITAADAAAVMIHD